MYASGFCIVFLAAASAAFSPPTGEEQQFALSKDVSLGGQDFFFAPTVHVDEIIDRIDECRFRIFLGERAGKIPCEDLILEAATEGVR